MYRYMCAHLFIIYHIITIIYIFILYLYLSVSIERHRGKKRWIAQMHSSISFCNGTLAVSAQCNDSEHGRNPTCKLHAKYH